jgi:hypothetical protein
MPGLAILALLAASAATSVVAADSSAWHPASVDIGGHHIMVFRVGAGGFTAAERRALLEFRLTEALTRTWTLAREWGDSIKRTFEAVGPARQLRLEPRLPWRVRGHQ